MSQVDTTTVSIASGGKLSTAADLRNMVLVGVQIPAEWTDADLDFEVSGDGQAFGALHLPTSDSPYTVSAAAGRCVSLQADHFLGWRYVKVRSTQNQGAARSVTLVSREF